MTLTQMLGILFAWMALILVFGIVLNVWGILRFVASTCCQ